MSRPGPEGDTGRPRLNVGPNTPRKRPLSAVRAARGVLRNEGRLLHALNIGTVGVVFFRLDGRIIDSNPAFERMAGYSHDELVGLDDWDTLIPAEFRTASLQAVRDLAARGEAAPFETQFLRKDGSPRWGLVAPTRLSLREDATECVAFVVDITERKRVEDALRASEAHLEEDLNDARLLREVSAQLIEEDDQDSLYANTLNAAMSIMRADCASLQKFHPDTRRLQLLAHRGLTEEAARFWGWMHPDDHSTCAVAVRRRRRVIEPNVAMSTSMAGTPDQRMLLRTGIRAVQSTPLLSRRGELVGMISTHWRRPHAPAERDLRMLDILARQAADLLERRQSEEALLAAQEELVRREQLARERIEAAIEQAPAALCLTWGPDHIFTLANERYLDLIGRQRAPVIGRPMREVVPDGSERFFEVLDGVYQTGEPYTGTERPMGVYRPDAPRSRSYVNYFCAPIRDEKGRVEGVFLHVYDVTPQVQARLEAEEARAMVAASEERFRALTTASSSMVFRVSPDWSSIWESRDHDPLAGGPEDTRDWLETYVHPEDQQLFMETVRAAIEKKCTFELEHRVLRADGSLGWTSSRATPIVGPDGDILEWFGASSDITIRRRAEEVEVEARLAAEEAVRVREEFLSIASHELRNPVAAVRGSVQMLQRMKAAGTLSPERLEAYFQNLETSSRQLARLTDDLLDLSRLQRGRFPLRPEPTHLPPLLIALAESERWEGRRITVLCPPECPVAVVDPDRITQIVENLLDNALKYSSPDAPVVVRLEAQADGFLVQVRDYGIGLPPDALEAIFDPFRRAVNATGVQGLGLGLSISRRIAEEHGGRMWAESDGEGRGTAVNAWLPWEGTPPAEP